MFDKLIFKIKNPKYCKHCGGRLRIDEKFEYSDQTGRPIVRYVSVRCEHQYSCFEEYGYLFEWSESVGRGR